jgi:F420-non-reducing hydrogenase small subunit
MENMGNRPKIALYWCAGCGGCEESVIDLAEDLLTVAGKADIVFWPVALDVRYRDIEALDDGSIDATFINGAIRLDEHVRMVRLLRRKSKRIVAHGTCAHLGGVVGLANLSTPRQLLESAYRQVPSMADRLSGPMPGEGVEGPSLPELLPVVKALDQVIPVDAVIPGCPPPPETMARAIQDVIDGRLPPEGTVYADRKALCHGCPRLDTRPEKIEVTRFKRLHETRWDPEVCFLPQGLICLGPVTRGGCNARCIGANMPCRGCFGPTERVDDFGAGAVTLIAAMMAESEEPGLTQLIESIPDPTGLFYRYCLAASVLGKRGRP